MMRKILTVCACALWLTGALASRTAFAGEQTVSFKVDGKAVVGTLNLPDGVARPPVVLLLHGFKSSRDEVVIPSVKEGVFRRAARVFADKGIASLRIDFMGSGDSEGDYADTTLQVQLADALAALDYLAARPDVDARKISIVGWSMGGAIAAVAAGRSRHRLASVTLWEASNNPAASMAFSFGPDFVLKALNGGDTPAVTKTSWGAEVRLKGAFFRSLAEIDPVAEIRTYHGPLLVTSGSEDTAVFPQPQAAQAFLDYHDGPEELWARPMDHVFNAFKDHDTVDALIDKTADFIAKASVAP
jgi:hypothetical protein